MTGVLVASPVGTGFGDMLAHPFMRYAFGAGIPIAALAGLVGYFMVLRAEVFSGDALSHVAFTGALAALAVGLDARLGLLAAPAGAATRLTRNPHTGLALSAALSVAAMALGLTASYLIPKLPPSTAILLVAVLTYAATFARPGRVRRRGVSRSLPAS